jgi:5-methylcytosine-specific restriction endonuclease McrA
MHHIVPRANGGKNSKNNLVALCSKCHGLVYIPTETHGIHSKRGKDSFQIIAWRDSTRGKVLECKSLQTGEIYYI